MKFVPTILLIASLGGVASAASITQVKTFSFVPSGSPALTFNKFDNLGGTLTLTSITITTNVLKTGGQLELDNESASPATGTISQSVTITLNSVDVALLNGNVVPGAIGSNVIATSTASISVGADDGDGFGFQGTGVDYATTGVFGSVTNTNTGNVGAVFWGAYTGVGTYVINAGGTQGFDTSAIGGAATASAPATAGSDVTVTYNYIPEPASALLGGLGLLTLLRRRRN